MNFIDTFGLLKYIGIYQDIGEDPGFRKMVDVAIDTYDIDSETFVASLQYAKVFNKQMSYDLLGAVDIGLMAGTVTEVTVSGVTTSSMKTVADVEKVASKTGHYNEGAIEHIFSGNKSGGLHYEGLEDTYAHVVGVRSAPNAHGVYQATVQYGSSTKTSTFFPKNWTSQQVLNTIEEAYSKMQYTGSRNIYEAVTKTGVKVQLYIDEATKKIISAFPIM